MQHIVRYEVKLLSFFDHIASKAGNVYKKMTHCTSVQAQFWMCGIWQP